MSIGNFQDFENALINSNQWICRVYDVDDFQQFYWLWLSDR